MPQALFGYQEQGAAFLAARLRAGLFDEMGVGKSAQAIRALDLRGSDRNWIVCRGKARKNWRAEFNKFATRYRRLCIGETIHDFVAWRRGRFDTLITSYDQAAKWAPYVHEDADLLDAVIFDEAQDLRNPSTQRVLRLLGKDTGNGGLMQWAVQSWFLTGTPIWNDPIDIYPFLRSCGVMPLSREEFAKRYFKARMGAYSTTHTPRGDMLPELRTLIANNSISRTLQHTGVEIPPLVASTYLVDGDAEPVRQLLLSHPGLDEMIIQALEEGCSISNLETDHVATLRRLIGEAKAVPYAALLKEELADGLDKMVVFGIHRSALNVGHNFIQSHGIGSAIINGETSSRQDEHNLQRFASDSTCRVLWCNIQAAGTSLTMTASCHVDMLESAWTDKANVQAIKRVHRITQTRGVRARFITLADSFDEVVNEIVARKAATAAMIEGK